MTGSAIGIGTESAKETETIETESERGTETETVGERRRTEIEKQGKTAKARHRLDPRLRKRRRLPRMIAVFLSVPQNLGTDLPPLRVMKRLENGAVETTM